MYRRSIFGLSAVAVMASALLPGNSSAQQAAHHRYLIRAEQTTDGMRSLQKQSASGLRAGVVKFNEAVGCKLESWYFDYADSTAYAFVDCPDEIAAAALQSIGNSSGFARVTYRPVLSAEDMDKALAKAAAVRPPQQQ